MTPELARMVAIFSIAGSPDPRRGRLPAFQSSRMAFEGLIWPFPWHSDALLPSVAVERITVEAPHAGADGGCGRSSAMSRKISWNICRGIATSAIWKAT